MRRRADDTYQGVYLANEIGQIYFLFMAGHHTQTDTMRQQMCVILSPRVSVQRAETGPNSEKRNMLYP